VTVTGGETRPGRVGQPRVVFLEALDAIPTGRTFQLWAGSFLLLFRLFSGPLRDQKLQRDTSTVASRGALSVWS